NNNSEEILDSDNINLNRLIEFDTCSKQACFDQIGYEQFLACQTAFESLDKKILPLPEQHLKEVSMPIVFLPTSYNYASVYSLMPSLQFMTPKSDLCDTCKMMKMDIQYTTQYEKKLELTKNFLAHLNRAQEEYDYYNINIVNTIEDSKHNQNIVGSQVLFKSFDSMAYIAYNLAQNVQIPNSLQQVGSLYFKNFRKVHLFGICNTGNFPQTQQTN
ncbi:25706_t:CDS:2, partial [Gigaspora margarita]